jgi:hypothetical protein
MAAHGKSKYSYGESGSKDLYGVDAPCFLESPEFKSLTLKVTGLVFQFSGEITAGQIVRYICGDMEKGRDRQRFEGYIADAIETLCSHRIIERQGVLRITYAKAEPVKPYQEVVDGEKLSEFTKYKQREGMSYATGF